MAEVARELSVGSAARPKLALALRAGVPRLKVIQEERGDSPVSIGAYAQIASALGAEFTVLPARRPTLDEVCQHVAGRAQLFGQVALSCILS